MLAGRTAPAVFSAKTSHHVLPGLICPEPINVGLAQMKHIKGQDHEVSHVPMLHERCVAATRVGEADVIPGPLVSDRCIVGSENLSKADGPAISADGAGS